MRGYARRQIEATGAFKPVDGFDIGEMAFDIPKAIVTLVASAIDDAVVLQGSSYGAGQGHCVNLIP